MSKTGWDTDGEFRWIEAGPLRLDENDHGAIVTIQGSNAVGWAHGGSNAVGWTHGSTGTVSSDELAALVRHLAGWFAEDPTETVDQIETSAKYVRAELEKWNDLARIDEEHPPYDKLTRALDALLLRCDSLREDIGKFAEEGP